MYLTFHWQIFLSNEIDKIYLLKAEAEINVFNSFHGLETKIQSKYWFHW